MTGSMTQTASTPHSRYPRTRSDIASRRSFDEATSMTSSGIVSVRTLSVSANRLPDAERKHEMAGQRTVGGSRRTISGNSKQALISGNFFRKAASDRARFRTTSP